MEKINFTKMSGAGNDFILIDKKDYSSLSLNENIISKICDRRNGIGADGVITISDIDGYDFSMEYYNADGSTGTLCGNGARCALKFAGLTNRVKNRNAKFLSNNVSYGGELLSENIIKFYFNEPKDLRKFFNINAAGQLIKASFLDTGSPHVIININDVLRNVEENSSSYKNIDEFPVFKIGKEIRYSSEFEPKGTNVNFIQLNGDEVFIRTYERGVENETLACGTGSTAAALVAYFNYEFKPPVSLITRGGSKLIVDFTIEDEKVKNLSLTGPAEVIFTGEIILNKFY